MTCFPSTYQVFRPGHKPPTDIKRLCQIAYDAVNKHMNPSGNLHWARNRQLYNIWNIGPDCLFKKSRIRQVTFARGLVLNYLQTVAGFGCKKSAEIFGQHYSTALYWKEYIKDIRRQKFDSDEKDALMMFDGMVGNGR